MCPLPPLSWDCSHARTTHAMIYIYRYRYIDAYIDNERCWLAPSYIIIYRYKLPHHISICFFGYHQHPKTLPNIPSPFMNFFHKTLLPSPHPARPCPRWTCLYTAVGELPPPGNGPVSPPGLPGELRLPDGRGCTGAATGAAAVPGGSAAAGCGILQP